MNAATMKVLDFILEAEREGEEISFEETADRDAILVIRRPLEEREEKP